MLSCRAFAIASVGLAGLTSPLSADVFVSDLVGDAIRWYSDAGALKGTLTGNGIDNPSGMTLGPDGLLYVANAASRRITRHDPTTGAFVDTFITPDNGNLSDPDSVAFGRDGNLYVTDFVTDRILRYDGQTGDLLAALAFPGTFASPIGITAGPDGDLFFNASFLDYKVFRIDGGTGTFEGEFATLPSQGWHATFGPDGNLYTPLIYHGTIHRTDGNTGGNGSVFADFANAIGLDFLPNATCSSASTTSTVPIMARSSASTARPGRSSTSSSRPATRAAAGCCTSPNPRSPRSSSSAPLRSSASADPRGGRTGDAQPIDSD